MPASDFSPFFDDFAALPSPTSETPGPNSPSQTQTQGQDEPWNLSLDGQQVIEEDKRRRNTEASARFRVKKKEREQHLERTATETSEKVGALEEKCRQLERENGWLRGLIVEKRDNVKGERKKKGRKSEEMDKDKGSDGGS